MKSAGESGRKRERRRESQREREKEFKVGRVSSGAHRWNEKEPFVLRKPTSCRNLWGINSPPMNSMPLFPRHENHLSLSLSPWNFVSAIIIFHSDLRTKLRAWKWVTWEPMDGLVHPRFDRFFVLCLSWENERKREREKGKKMENTTARRRRKRRCEQRRFKQTQEKLCVSLCNR